ncbi:MAG: 2-oxoglutarate and iron-dependent oxygenase domain-containing protein [Bacteroidia bacterium]|nr:isopenicillin N synthase family oxygenase [Bacteroidia bacterium]MDW8159519.1 2-oxoglutarate and iron-dependent oxygenase domain-containing protein [Bacteroidia bacterium]
MIPTLNLKDFTKGTTESRQKFVQDLGQAYEKIGFVAIQNHELEDAFIAELYAAVKKFFDLPDATKKKYEREDLAGQRGYTGKLKEHAKDQTVADLKEFYQIGQELENPEVYGYPANVWPEEVPEFKPLAIQCYRKLEAIGRQMLRAIALYLDLPEDYFEDKVHHGNSILRAIHYFPLKDIEIEPGAVRSAAHEDINLITLLIGASAAGLQVLTRDGQWIDITAIPGTIVVNVGDMLQRLTNNKLRSTTHRVVNPPAELAHTARYSIPFFLHPKSDMDLSCLPSCITEDNPKQYEDITAGEYLRQRLIEIGLLKV